MSEWLDHMVLVCLTFEEIAKSTFQSGRAVLHSHQQCLGASLPTLGMSSLFYLRFFFFEIF